jgi:cytidylate kinase
VRSALLVLQRRVGDRGGVILEGRDIGTVVFPDAEVKFFLTAAVDVRAARRHRQLVDLGEAVPLEHVRRAVEERDLRDTQRPVAPLRQAPDAILVDCSDLDSSQVVARMASHVRGVAAQMQGSRER